MDSSKLPLRRLFIALYAGVTITTEVGEPKSIEKDGMLIIVQDEISHVNATPETLSNVIKQIKEIRKSIVE